MFWSWLWIGGALLVGLYAGMTLMSLLATAKLGSRESARGAMQCPARMPRAPVQHRRPA